MQNPNDKSGETVEGSESQNFSTEAQSYPQAIHTENHTLNFRADQHREALLHSFDRPYCCY